MTAGQIDNRNFLSPTGFKFTLTRTPKVSFFCNQANIPDLVLGVAIQPSYTKMLPTPGDIIEFGDLTLRFLVDENLENYMEIQNWIRGLGFPERISQFAELEETGIVRGNYSQDRQNIYSDGTLQVLTSSQIPNFQITFKDLFPYSLSTMTFDATDTDMQYFTADVSFKYTIYNIVDMQGNPLYEY
jgi:hypothetical protein